MKMLAENIEDFSTYAPNLKPKTIAGLAGLILEGRKPSTALMHNLVLRDTQQISNDEFFQLELQRILGNQALAEPNVSIAR